MASQSPYTPMTTSRDAPNPLRPYYVPPSIGAGPGQPNATNSTSTSASSAGFGRSARDLLSELDYGGPLLDRDGPSLGEMAKKILDQAVWKYTSVLLAQPLDVAKVVLQVKMAESDVAAAEKKSHSRSRDSSRRQAEVCTKIVVEMAQAKRCTVLHVGDRVRRGRAIIFHTHQTTTE